MFNFIKEKIIYGNKWLISVYSYKELLKLERLWLYKPLKDKQLKYLNFLKKDTNIRFYYNDYDNIFKCIKFLLDNGYKDITIQLDNNEKFNNYI